MYLWFAWHVLFQQDPKIEVFTCSLKDHRFEILVAEHGQPLTLASLHQKSLVFAMNGGIFQPGYRPSGLLTRAAQALYPLNLASGSGNFYLKPNGVFFIVDGHAQITNSESYAQLGLSPDWAIQSGPLLVENGVLHPQLDPGGTQYFSRNGVGITDQGQLVLWVFLEPVTLYKCAEILKTKWHCSWVLYLDGSISGFRWGKNGMNLVKPYATILAVHTDPPSQE